MIDEDSPKMTKIDAKGSKPVARFHFTKRAIERLVPDQTRAYFYDEKVRGLALAVDPSGRKTFVLYKKLAGVPSRLRIGVFPDVSVDHARAEAQRMLSAIAGGANPARERRAIREEMTLGELFDGYWLPWAKENKKTSDNDVWMFGKYLPSWRLKKLSSIQRPDVVALHAHVSRTHGKYTANRVIELLSAMFTRASSDWGFQGSNPAAKIKPNKERKRKRFLDGHELPDFFRALAEEPNELMRHFFLIALLTGQRRSNVQEMEWSEIDWTRHQWNIPHAKAKADEDITVELMPLVIDILTKRRTEALKADEPSPWVFPGTGRSGHLIEPKRAWGRILDSANIANLRMHDLRRTLGSWEAITGASLAIIGKSLGHGSLQATEVYAHLNQDPVRAAVSRATETLLKSADVTALLGDGNGQ